LYLKIGLRQLPDARWHIFIPKVPILVDLEGLVHL
jgi:hypothetical protein